jgi:hypothetical protein
MKLLEKYTNPETPSFIILLLPYLGIISIDQLLSPLSSIVNTIAILVSISIFNYFFVKALSPINKKIRLNIFVNSFLFCLFYGEIIIEKSFKLTAKIFPNLIINQWIIISIIFFSSLLLYKWLYNNHKEVIRFLKTFFIFFALTMVVYKINQNKSYFNLKNNFITIAENNSVNSDKPILLIITDGYVSPDGLYKYYKDSSIYDFSNSLKKNGWMVNNNSKSEEITTVHSLSSLFNFNFTIENKKGISSTFWEQKMIYSTLYDSLKNKNIQFYNFGMFDIGATKRLTPIYYYYPTSAIGQFFDKSMMNVKYIYNDSGLIEKQNKHNRYILDSMPNFLMKIKGKSFIYAHLFMPHDPYQYFNEFTTSSKTNPNKYFDYWQFTNSKLDVFLTKLTKENKYRIIITGDHGYGNIGGNFKAEDTFTAFYGFDSTAIKSIHSVQDLGSLINGSF